LKLVYAGWALQRSGNRRIYETGWTDIDNAMMESLIVFKRA